MSTCRRRYRNHDHRVPTAPTSHDGIALGGDDGNRTHVQGFAGPCLNHSATSPSRTTLLRPEKTAKRYRPKVKRRG